MKEKMDKLGFAKTKMYCSLKDAVRKIKEKSYNLVENIKKIHISKNKNFIRKV